MSEKREKIDGFLKKLVNLSSNDATFGRDTGDEAQKVLTRNFALVCRKCGSSEVFTNIETGCDYGPYTGYQEGQILFKCMGCGNASSFSN